MMSDLSLEIIGDFAIVWLLSPKKTFSAAPRSGPSQFISRLPGHSLQVEHCPAPPSYISIIMFRDCDYTLTNALRAPSTCRGASPGNVLRGRNGC